jgi:hopanoid biosynthesis associated RND transporter like protein HpnN
VCRCPRIVLAVSFGLCLLSAWGAVTRLEYHTQRNDLISAHKECQQRWRKYLDEFGDDDDMVVVVRGGDHERMKQALEAVAAEVAGRPELFDRLFYKVDLRPLRDRALLLLPLDQVRALHDGPLADMGPLLDNAPVSWHALGLLTLVQEAGARAVDLRPGRPLAPRDERFFAQLLAVSRTARATLDRPSNYRSPWGSLAGPTGPEDQGRMLDEPQYFFNGDGSLAFLLARPVKEQGSFTAALRSVSGMREIVARVRANHPDLEIGLTGLPVLETDEMVAAEHDTRLASWLALAAVTVLFLIVYRGVAYPALTVLTLLVGTAWAMGWLTLTIGHLNILSATFAVMLIGMGDYGVLWVMRYEQARRQGADVRTALLHTTTHVAVGNLTAASTLALAFFAAIFADFKAVAELGWIAGCGVLLCAFACFTVLPSLLMLFDRRGKLAPTLLGSNEPVVRPGRRDDWLPALARRPRLVLAVGAAIIVGLGTCAARVSYDHNLLHLQAQDLESVRWEMVLVENTSGASWHALSYADSPEEARRRKAEFEKLPGVSRAVEIGSLLPGDQREKLLLLRKIRSRLAKLPARGGTIAHAVPDLDLLHDELATLLDRLGPLAAGGGPSGKMLAELRRDLAALNDQSCALARRDGRLAGERLRDLDRRLTEDLAEGLHRLRAVSTPTPITLEDLPQALRERHVGRSGKWLVRVFARNCLWDFAPLEQFTKEVKAVDPEATGKPFGTVEGLKAMKNGLERAGLYAFLVIVLVLWVDFRTPRRMLLALTPLLVGVLLALGVMGLCGLPLNPANMIAFPLILGVGVDNGVHVLHDYLIRRREGRPGVSHAIGRGVLVKALTTMIGFATLMISTERGLAGLGLVLTLGVGCSMLSALVLLPAALQLLGGPQARATPAARQTERRAA